MLLWLGIGFITVLFLNHVYHEIDGKGLGLAETLLWTILWPFIWFIFVTIIFLHGSLPDIARFRLRLEGLLKK